MPGNTAVGLSFDTTSIKQADEAIKKLVKNAETGIGKVNAAWKDMTKDGLNHFIQGLGEAQKVMSQLSGAKVNVRFSGQANDLKKLGDMASQAIPQVNKLLFAMQQLASINVRGLGGGGVSATAMDAQKINYLEQQIRLLQDQLKIQQEISNAVGSQARGTSNVRQGMSDLESVARRVRQIASTLFSVQALAGYVNGLIKVRGEFELQQRALQAIVQNVDEANKLWGKTVALAVQSPFRVKELVTYTKQLAAYRVETENLYDTTKMLADVSAGLGVDMNRLILAYGQVKAANYLRGTELRQFSEAGINVLGELATYFTELEGRVVSVGDVFERVSKRMVSFADVEEVFKRITSEGGIFFNMQEIQAETLKGQISNLKDSIDIMLNDIGKANEKTIKNMVALTRTFVEGWRTIGTTLTSLGAALSVVAIARAKDTLSTIAWTKANLGAIAAGKGFTSVVAKMILGLKNLWTAMLSNPITATYAALAALAVVIYKVVKRQRELNKAYEESVGKIHAQYIETKKYADSISELVTRQNELIEANKTLSKDSDEYKSNQQEIATIEEKRKEILKELVKIDPEYAKSIQNAGNDLKTLIPLAEEYNEKLRARLALESSLKDINADKATEKYNKAMTKQQARLGDVERTRNTLIKEAQDLLSSGNLYEAERKALEEFVNGSEPYYKRATKLYKDLQTVVLDLGTVEQQWGLETRTVKKIGISTLFHRLDLDSRIAIEKYIKSLDKLTRKEKRVIKDMTDIAEEWKNVDMGVRLTSIIADEKATEEDKAKAKNEIISFFEEVLNEKGIVGAIADKARSVWSSIFDFDWKKTNIPTPLTGWRAVYDEFVKTLSTGAIPSITEEEDESSYIETLRKNYESYAKDIEGWDANNAKLRAQYTKEQMDRIKAENAERKKAIDWLTYEKKETGGTGENKELKELNERIRLVRELRKEYETLNKTFDAQDSANRVRESFRKAWESIMPSDLSIDAFDFTNPEGVVAQLEELKTKITPEAVELVNAIEKAIAKESVEIDVVAKKNADEVLLKSIQDMFDQYDLSLELKKLNIPPDLAKSLFGIESINLSDIREKVEGELDSAKAAGGQEDRVAQLEKDLEKINDMEDKAQIERLKTYLQYTRDAIGERAKIKIEEMTKLQEIDETFTKAMNEAKTEEDKKRIAEQRKLAEEGVRKESSDKTNKLDWEDFKTSETFVSIFRDLDSASDDLLKHAIERIQEFREEWKDMPIADAKEMINKLNELEMALLDTGKPFADYRKANTDIEAAMMARGIKPNAKRGKSQEELRSRIGVENKEMEDIIAQASVIESVLQSINNATGENKQEQLALIGINEEYVASLGLSEDVLTNTVEKNEEILEDERSKAQLAATNIAQNKETLQQLSTQKNRLEQQADAIGKAQKMANDLYDAFKGLAEALGADGDSPAAIFADMGMSMLNTVLNTIQLQLQLHAATIAAQGLGVAMNAAMGVVGWIVMAIQLLAQLITAIVQANDKRIDAQVEELTKKVEELEKRYDKLAETVDEIYNIEKLRQVSEELDYIYEQEKKNLQAAIALRKSDKNISDDEWDEIARLEEDLADLEEQHRETKEEFKEGLGSVSNTKDATREFVDAWVDAFKETGDGLSGLQEHFTEFWDDIVARQATMKVAERFLEPLFAQLDKDLDDYNITQEEARALKAKAEEVMPELSKVLEQIWTSLGGSGGEGSGVGLTELQKGIQGITEDTAQIIESYMNSIRYYVETLSADNSSLLNEVRAMHTLLSSVVVLTGHQRGGAGIKVFADFNTR